MIKPIFGPELDVVAVVGCRASTSAVVGDGNEVSSAPTPLPVPLDAAFPPEEREFNTLCNSALHVGDVVAGEEADTGVVSGPVVVTPGGVGVLSADEVGVMIAAGDDGVPPTPPGDASDAPAGVTANGDAAITLGSYCSR